MQLRQRALAAIAMPALLSALCALAAAEPDLKYDIAFRGGLVVDGTGGEPRQADVGVVAGRIARVGTIPSGTAREDVEIEGLVLSPGFIDVHSHAERGLVHPELRANRGYVTQGVTTTVFGVDGAYSLSDMRSIIQTLDAQGVGTNFMFYIGHNGIRADVMGYDDRAPEPVELAKMRGQVRRAMQMGAVGLSSGLMYLPGRYAATAEVVELAKEIRRGNGVYDSHIRDPANALLESIKECLDIANAAGVRAHPAHLKVVGKRNFGKSREIVAMIEEYIAGGLEVTADVYPYDGAAARRLVAILVPPESDPMRQTLRLLEAGLLSETRSIQALRELAVYWQRVLRDPERRAALKARSEEPGTGVFSWIDAVGYESFRIVVSEDPGNVGRALVDIAQERDQEPFDVIADLILAEGESVKITLGAIDEDELRYLLVQPWVMISSDGKITGMKAGGGHPRYRGSFPRVLGRYVREWKVLSLAEAIRKMTSLPASYLQLPERGLVREGYWADLTVFDPETIVDRSTWKDPSLYSEGVIHVVVNGEFALQNGQMTGAAHGRFLPRGGVNKQ